MDLGTSKLSGVNTRQTPSAPSPYCDHIAKSSIAVVKLIKNQGLGFKETSKSFDFSDSKYLSRTLPSSGSFMYLTLPKRVRPSIEYCFFSSLLCLNSICKTSPEV